MLKSRLDAFPGCHTAVSIIIADQACKKAIQNFGVGIIIG